MKKEQKSSKKKLDKLTALVKASKYTVFYTGAGVSTSAGVGDYRGPSGAWTVRKIKELQRQGERRTAEEEEELRKLLLEQKLEEKKAKKSVSMMDALPTPTHMAQATLIRLGLAHFVVTTNLDGIYRKTGLLAHTQLCCLHGDVYVERCTACGYDFERNYHVRQENLHVHDHKVGICERCDSKPPANYKGSPGKAEMKKSQWGGIMVGTNEKNCGTKDTHINFGEYLDSMDWDEADTHCRKADLCIIAGTSMSLRHITHFPFLAKKVVLINLQPTPDDKTAHLRIWAKCDPVFEGLMERLNIPIDPIPVWKPRDGVPIKKIPSWVDSHYIQKAMALEKFYNNLEKEYLTTDIQQLEIKNNKDDPKALPSKIIVGNTHEITEKGDNSHKWTIYVSLPDDANLEPYVDFVEFKLHHTFSPPTAQVKKAPFSITRTGWGTFTVQVSVHWKPEFKSSPLILEHTLNFSSPDTSNIINVPSK